MACFPGVVLHLPSHKIQNIKRTEGGYHQPEGLWDWAIYTCYIVPLEMSTNNETPCRRHDYVVQLLLQRGSDPNSQAAYGDSPLYWAAYNGNKFVAELLINRGANILNENRGGNTALHIAAYHGNTDVVKLLLNHGADPKAQNNSGENALAFAYWGSRYRKRVEDFIKIVALLS